MNNVIIVMDEWIHAENINSKATLLIDWIQLTELIELCEYLTSGQKKGDKKDTGKWKWYNEKKQVSFAFHLQLWSLYIGLKSKMYSIRY